MRVWVTRAEPGASATAERLRIAGHVPLVAPLLRVVALLAPERPPHAPGGLAFTSANGVAALVTAFPSMPATTLRVWAVGEATAEAARAAGFASVTSANGDVAALAVRIAADRPAGRVLHAAAAERAGDLEGALRAAGVEVLTLPLYRTDAVQGVPPAAAAALRAGALEAVLLHSPRAGRALAAVLKGHAFHLGRVRALGLSPACLEPLRALDVLALHAAARPEEAALFSRLGEAA